MIALLCVQPLVGQTRFAVVRFDAIAKELTALNTVDKRLEAAIIGTEKDPRFVQMQKTSVELDEILKRWKELKPEADKKVRVELATKAEALRKELQALQGDYEQFKTEEVVRIKRSMLKGVRATQARFREVVAKVAEERGFDGVFEITGDSNTSKPVLVYAKNPTDITGDVLAILKAEEAAATPKPDAPSGDKPAPTQKPSPKP
ncbi:MAG: OmpH family outer membrane protein [Verrucomicrobia bacterium]|nr:OmpH family outer membrane protein [Verrucomicrobiota bacterium]